MARTKQTVRISPECVQARLELKAEASKQIEAWQQANAEAAPTQDGLLARLRARLFGPRRPGVQEVAEHFDILAELPHDLRILVFIEAGPASLARLALASKLWCTLVTRTLPQAVPPSEAPPTITNRKGLAQVLEAVASRLHPVELCLLVREMNKTIRKIALKPRHLSYAVAQCSPQHRDEWTAELLLDVYSSTGYGKKLLSSFVDPLILAGLFEDDRNLITIVQQVYCDSSKDFFDWLVHYHVAHLQEHEEGMADAWQLPPMDRYAELSEDVVTYQTVQWECGMSLLGTWAGEASPRLPMQSVLYLLQRALAGSWRAAAAAGMGNGSPAEARMSHRVACFFSAWAPAVDFPASWPSQDVAAWFAPWCDAQLSVQARALHREYDHGHW